MAPASVHPDKTPHLPMFTWRQKKYWLNFIDSIFSKMKSDIGFG